jgi:hypothetical protein
MDQASSLPDVPTGGLLVGLQLSQGVFQHHR